MQIGELAGLAVGATVLLNVMFAGYQPNQVYLEYLILLSNNQDYPND